MKCHPAETKLHSQTAMAKGMQPALTSAFGQHITDHALSEGPGGFRFIYTPVENGLQVTAQLGSKEARGVIEWVLGVGKQGQTPIIRVGDTLYESRVSYFSKINQYGITVGHPPGISPDADHALGRKKNRSDATACLSCHTTGLTKDLEPVIPGIQCARCHEGADAHAADSKAPVVNPRKLTARQQVELCGVCHRTKAPVDDRQIENVRFQPLRLMKSQCFLAGDISCLTCHVAHRDAVRNGYAFYNEKCKSCHGVTVAKVHTDERSTGNCVGCHMPAVQLHPGLRFTDHFIRVVTPTAGNG